MTPEEFAFLQAHKDRLFRENRQQFQEFLEKRDGKKHDHAEDQAESSNKRPRHTHTSIPRGKDGNDRHMDHRRDDSKDFIKKELHDILKPMRRGRDASPFTPEIDNCPHPKGFKLPDQIQKYNGDTDPRDHLHIFQTAMIFKSAPEETMCNAFPMYLEGKARGWFWDLPRGSIRSFEDLAEQFLLRFYQRKRLTKTIADLMNIRQGRDETLKAFVDRFNDESMQVEGRTDQLVISAFMNGIQPGILYTRLAQETPQNIKELHERVEIFCKGEEANRRKRENEKLERKQEDKKRGNTSGSKSTVHDRLNFAKGRKEPKLSNNALTPLTGQKS